MEEADYVVDQLRPLLLKVRSRARFRLGLWTVPKDLQPFIRVERLWEIVQQVKYEFLSDGGRYELGGVVGKQFWHTSNPFNGYYPHVHDIEFCVQNL